MSSTPPHLPPCGVTAIGMVSSLGRDALSSCAASRAGLSIPSELKVVDVKTQALVGEEKYDGPPSLLGHIVRGQAEGFAGPGKALVLGTLALRDLMNRRRLSLQEQRHTGLVVNLSDWAMQDALAVHPPHLSTDPLPSAAWRKQTATFAQRLATKSELDLAPTCQVTLHGGSAGMALAVREAMTLLHAGKVERCIVGGIDSRVEPSFLKAAAVLNRLRTTDNPVGLTPGEGAAFLLLEPLSKAGRLGARAQVDAVASALEPASSFADIPPTGASLAQAILGVLRKEPPRGAFWFVGDLNGTERRAAEWGRAMARVHASVTLDDVPLWLPAASFGDTGAASAAMGTCLAVRAFERGYAPARACTVWMCSEGANRGALALRRLSD
ncbi:hypothetical protein [Chondromyces crocatus]|uniref:Beta-ketoacyl synthase N-terminal domain-containing protein n=1 Tax=Chondromyces crocatus TaxID=52 RepID=A0A0K1EIG2_CHOCO|nr:hypothetical protein [Chondromyces crocatus]AKT40383.1 uncharacterized protein CMC5_045360 [Chondromyces crocatus]